LARQIKIIIADDHLLMRDALKIWLKKQADFDIIAEAGDGAKAVELTRRLNPDVVIMDISMPELNGLEATRQISASNPDVAVLVLTIHNDTDTILSILQAGAKGYLNKNVSGKQVVQAVRSLVNEEVVLQLPVARKVIDSISQSKEAPPVDFTNKLTNRELQMIKLLAKGISNKEIAIILNIGERTVKSYISNIFMKLDVGTRTEAISKSIRSGILTVEDLKPDIQAKND
jgi:two-component system, NarL family, response regulator LiaR